VQIEQVLNYRFESDEMVTLPHLEMIDVFSHGLELQKISDQASSEAALELLLKKVIPFHFRFCDIPLCYVVLLKQCSSKYNTYNITFYLSLTYFSHKYHYQVGDFKQCTQCYRLTTKNITVYMCYMYKLVVLL
jgi:hypothetical protein